MQVNSHVVFVFMWPFDEGAWEHITLERRDGGRVATLLTYAVRGCFHILFSTTEDLKT